MPPAAIVPNGQVTVCPLAVQSGGIAVGPMTRAATAAGGSRWSAAAVSLVARAEFTSCGSVKAGSTV
jgi:hypothetical protein